MQGSGVLKFSEGLKDIARRVRIPPHSTETDEARLLEVKRWFEDPNNGNWILVIDNADNEADFAAKDGPIAKFIPYALDGTLIITTRSRQIASQQCYTTIEVGKMGEEEALELFSKRYCGRGSLKDKEKEDVAAILSTVHHLPLTIVGLADSMTSTAIPPSMYRNTIQEGEKRIKDLLLWNFSDIQREPGKENILDTYIATFDQIRRQMPRALDLLRLMAFFNHQNIPEELLTQCDLEGMDHSVDFPDAIGKLLGCWLVTMVECGCGVKRYYNLDRLVQLSLQEYLQTDELNQGRRAALEVISRLFPQSQDEQQYICPAYIPHALAATENLIDPTAEEIGVRVKLYLQERGTGTSFNRFGRLSGSPGTMEAVGSWQEWRIRDVE